MVQLKRRRQAERTRLSDRRLKAAAVGLIVERGVAGATLAAIGERAGYSRGLTTYRFGSKAGLLSYVHDTVATDWIARVKAAVGRRVGVAALLRVVDALHGFITDAPNDIRAMYLLRYGSIDVGTHYRTNVAKVHRAQHRDVQRWIEQGQDQCSIDRSVNSAQAAELFCATLDGLLYRWLVDPEVPIDRLHAQFKREVRRSHAPQLR
jgi:AcrR family transcriptional regulator